MRRSEADCVEVVHSFHFYADSAYQTQVTRQVLLPTEPAAPHHDFFS